MTSGMVSADRRETAMNKKYLKIAMPVAALGAVGFALAMPAGTAGASTAAKMPDHCFLAGSQSAGRSYQRTARRPASSCVYDVCNEAR